MHTRAIPKSASHGIYNCNQHLDPEHTNFCIWLAFWLSQIPVKPKLIFHRVDSQSHIVSNERAFSKCVQSVCRIMLVLHSSLFCPPKTCFIRETILWKSVLIILFYTIQMMTNLEGKPFVLWPWQIGFLKRFFMFGCEKS